MGRNNKRILVPEAGALLEQLKGKVMDEEGYMVDVNVPEKVKYEVAEAMGVPLKEGYNGDLKAKEAGKVGGSIGGKMVRHMIKQIEQTMAQQDS